MISFVWHEVTLNINQVDYLPMPAAARYCATGQPSPPQPTISTEALDKFSWPVDSQDLLCSVQSCYKSHFIECLLCCTSGKHRLWIFIPFTPSSGRRSCLLYRMMSSLLRAGLAFRGVRGVTLSNSSSTEVWLWGRNYYTRYKRQV